MPHARRTAVAAGLLTGLGALLVAPQVLPASAAPDRSAAATVARAGQALIQGVVVDQFGEYVDDVKVQATRADGTPVASALSYASKREDGPQHGYFYLEVSRGTYTLKLTREGYQPLVLKDVEVEKARQKVSLGENAIQKVLVASRTDAALAQKKVTTKQSGTVVVTVSAKGLKPAGDVEVREGRDVVGGGVLKSGNGGRLTIKLDRLPKGSHALKAVYLGSRSAKGSSSPTITLTVVKTRR